MKNDQTQEYMCVGVRACTCVWAKYQLLFKVFGDVMCMFRKLALLMCHTCATSIK